jgi:outer membrane protein TolC
MEKSTPGSSATQPPKTTAAKILIAFALLILSSVPARAQLSLATVVELAQRNSSQVRLAEADLRKAEAVLAQTKDIYVPNLVLGSNVGPPSIGFPTGQPSIASASMQSLVFSYQQFQYIKAARAGRESTLLALKDAREQVALDASTAYLELDSVTRELAAAHRQDEDSHRLIAIEEQRFDQGVDSRRELLQSRLTTAELKVRVLHLQSRAATLAAQLAALIGMPIASIATDHNSIPEIPAVNAGQVPIATASVDSARQLALSRQFQAHGDADAAKIRPLIEFGAQYNLDSEALNHYSQYYRNFTPNNFSAGLIIQLPLYDRNRRAKARESSADALRATVEAEQAQRQSDLQIATLSASIAELDALSEVAGLKQEIASDQLKTVKAELQSGNGAGIVPGATPQLSPKAEQLARIDESQKSIDAIDAAFDVNKARLSLLRALGHMEDWLGLLQGEKAGTTSIPARP